MSKSNHQEKFLELRQQFPFFVFESYDFQLSEAGLSIRFTFNLADKHAFHPAVFISRKSFFRPDGEILPALPALAFHLGLVELISYWKAACSPRLVIRPQGLTRARVEWWKKLWYRGLGEFFYLNSIRTSQDEFMEVEVVSDWQPGLIQVTTDAGILIPVGGGKDSVVTLELLKNRPGVVPLIMNPRGATLETVAVAGFSDDRVLTIERTLDPLLLSLNEQGFLNGHTPFSALLAFHTALAAMLTGHRNIALSNEASANEATIEGTDINHQYSKSFEFESDFREYVKKYLSRDINYFSFLRPLSELQIASLFAGFTGYHRVFRSCNAGSKTNTWCGKCPKCLFSCIILSPFLPPDAIRSVFGRNLLDDEALLPVLEELTGVAAEKPFDCIGTVEEVNLALDEVIRQYGNAGLPFLLQQHACRINRKSTSHGQFVSALMQFDGHHHLEPLFEDILKKTLNG
jgi:hypothetical protein